jgi:hypothetical protein
MEQFTGSLSYAVDIVFVIDCTGSMRPVLDEVKRGAMGFHERLTEAMGAKNKRISNLRIAVIAYRDFIHDKAEHAMSATPFFVLPDQIADFNTSVHRLAPFGGGDEPESGLEALALALQAGWERGLDRRRHIVVVFTDASAHPLERGAHVTQPMYGEHMPKSLDDLTEMWEAPQGGPMEFAAKRLLLYAPDCEPWNTISASWSNTLHYLSNAGQGLNDYEFKQIIDNIANSV